MGETRVKWTPEQQSVIDLRNRSMLVSAAAGSGKTAVLVERIVSMVTDPEHPMDIDQLLVVTFTNAAAREMSERVRNAIEKKLDEDPMNTHLQRQMTLIHNAQITTIDSFCLSVIRNHFHRISLEPGFRIADQGELKLLKEEVCDRVLDHWYEAADSTFLAFIDSYSTAKSDDRVKEMILRLYEYSQSYPWPEKWLDQCADQYRADSVEELEQKQWMKDFLAYLENVYRELYERYEFVYTYTLQEDGPTAYASLVESELDTLKELLECKSLREWKNRVSEITFSRLPSIRKYQGSEEKKEAVQQARNDIKDLLLKKYQAKYFNIDLEMQLDILNQTADMVAVLVDLTKSFADAFAREKERKNILDFSDVEHKALQILVDPVTMEYTSVAEEYRHQFKSVMIDEYQDSNDVQETLLKAVSRIPDGEENMFMVGDVKQSIYRFRQARPELFIEKYDRFSKEESTEQRIDLHKNFRSRGEVLSFVNDIFYRIMDRDLGNVAYDRDAALYQGAEYPDYETDCVKPECILVMEDPTEGDKKELEIRAIANRIHQIVDDQEIPGMEYRDVVILLRSYSSWAQSFQTIFEQEGIPLIVASKTGYFSTQEVQTVLSLLRIIDNPKQDIPLVSVMKSAMYGFSEKDLARIRTVNKEIPFYQCVLQLAKIEDMDGYDPELKALIPKIQSFMKQLIDFRSRVPYTAIHRLVQEILTETGYLNFAAALPGGAQRKANLDMLLEKAIAYEKTSYHGLFHFIRYIDRLMKYDVDYGEAEIVSDHENAVRLMTIHKSKGLEFPVVFVAGLGRNFNMTDSNSGMVFHPVFGIGLKWFDSDGRTMADTLMRKALSIEIQKESKGEELRVLYVALTRAKEKLILTGICKKYEPEQYEVLNEGVSLGFEKRYRANCFLDWVLPAILSYGSRYKIQLLTMDQLVKGQLDKLVSLKEEREFLEQELTQVDEEIYGNLEKILSWKYPFEVQERRKQKVSVSEIKHRMMDEHRAISDEEPVESLFPEETLIPYVPKFISEGEENVGALRGTAVHRFMECLNFAALQLPQERQAGIEYLNHLMNEMVDQSRMEESDARLINLYQVYQFLDSDAAWRMQQADKQNLLVKEQPFVMTIPAKMAWPEIPSDEDVLVQGIIDVFWEEEDGLVVLDYKTDHVSKPEELVGRYQVQLQLYADALERAFEGKPVKEILIYSFRLNQLINIDRGEDKS